MAKTHVSRVRLVLALLIVLFLCLNAVIVGIALASVLRGTNPAGYIVGGEETAFGFRVLLFLLSVAVAYFIGRLIYKFCFRAELDIGDSTNSAVVIILYLSLGGAVLAFAGVASWAWFPFLFLMLMLYSVISIWQLKGLGFALLGLGGVVLTFIVTLWAART